MQGCVASLTWASFFLILFENVVSREAAWVQDNFVPSTVQVSARGHLIRRDGGAGMQNSKTSVIQTSPVIPLENAKWDTEILLKTQHRKEDYLRDEEEKKRTRPGAEEHEDANLSEVLDDAGADGKDEETKASSIGAVAEEASLSEVLEDADEEGNDGASLGKDFRLTWGNVPLTSQTGLHEDNIFNQTIMQHTLEDPDPNQDSNLLPDQDDTPVSTGPPGLVQEDAMGWRRRRRRWHRRRRRWLRRRRRRWINWRRRWFIWRRRMSTYFPTYSGKAIRGKRGPRGYPGPAGPDEDGRRRRDHSDGRRRRRYQGDPRDRRRRNGAKYHENRRRRWKEARRRIPQGAIVFRRRYVHFFPQEHIPFRRRYIFFFRRRHFHFRRRDLGHVVPYLSKEDAIKSDPVLRATERKQRARRSSLIDLNSADNEVQNTTQPASGVIQAPAD